MSGGQKSFVKGAAILGLFGLIVKVIGAVFRIPLTNVIGSEGIANYNVAYPLYALLVVISTAGLPAAISRMVAERVSLGDYRGAHNVFKTAFKVLLIIGIASAAILLLVSKAVAASVKIPSAEPCAVFCRNTFRLQRLLSGPADNAAHGAHSGC